MTGRTRLLGTILMVLAARTLAAQSVVSSANYRTNIAPNSLASIIGSNLARSTASATLDANGQLPTELGGASVDVDGKTARLLYASPGQINLLVPADVSLGTVDVLIRTGSSTQNTTARVTNTAPGVFTMDASGTGAGAILNAVTYAAAPFQVDTPEIPGDDQRTRLAIYSTGLRYSGNPDHDADIANVSDDVFVTARDAIGNSYSLEVAYAGAAPGYFGLDQVNVILPAGLDTGGIASLLVTADSGSANVVTFEVQRLPSERLHLSAIKLGDSYVSAGSSTVATVSLNGVARNNTAVLLRSNNTAVQVPSAVTVPAGSSAVTATIETSSVPASETATITASVGSAVRTASLQVDPANAAQLSSFTLELARVEGGHTVSATVTLSQTAPAAGIVVRLSSDDSAATPPESVTIPFGGRSATVAVATKAVSSSQTVTLTATLGSVAKTAEVTVAPAIEITLNSETVAGGNSVNGKVTIAEAAAAPGAAITLRSSNTAIATVPLSFSIPTGDTSNTFTVATASTVQTERTVTISAVLQRTGATVTASLTVVPAGSAKLESLTITPDHVTGGNNATGTVTLSSAAPAGGARVTLSASSGASLYATIPASVTVAQGQSSATFPIATTRVTSSRTVTVTGSYGGSTKTATLAVQ